MIDTVVTDRIARACLTGGKADIPDVPVGERMEHYRQLAWVGFTSTQIAKATGWNVPRLQQDLQCRYEKRLDDPRTVVARADEVNIETDSGSITIRTLDHDLIVEGKPLDLLHVGRLMYGAASSQYKGQAA